ncbi:MAG: TIGR04086 family membrane protein [Lachnospiraceae bacterium]|nr:TIGR04086 family membrane protein [Lachnospiraceae bacterium]
MEKVSGEKKFTTLLAALLAAWLLTGAGLLLLSVLMFRFGLEEEKLSIGITILYVAATFLGGSMAGGRSREKKYLWGLLSGLLYFCILFGISIIRKRTGAIPVRDLILTACLCLGGGTLGGMLVAVHR